MILGIFNTTLSEEWQLAYSTGILNKEDYPSVLLCMVDYTFLPCTPPTTTSAFTSHDWCHSQQCLRKRISKILDSYHVNEFPAPAPPLSS